MISKSLGISSRKFARLRADFPDVGLFAQALYPLLVANADDWGRQKADAFTVKHSVWSTAPEAEAVFAAALDAMKGAALIRLYTIDGETYAQVVDFDAHQQGLHKRTPSKFPAPSDGDSGASGKFPEPPQSSPLRELNLTELNRTELSCADDDDEHRIRFDQFWAQYPRQEGQPAALAAWKLIPNLTSTHFAEIMAGVARWRMLPRWRDAIASGDLQYVLTPVRWLSEARWTELKAVTPSAPRCPHTPGCDTDVACTQRELRAQLHPHRPTDVVPIEHMVSR